MKTDDECFADRVNETMDALEETLSQNPTSHLLGLFAGAFSELCRRGEDNRIAEVLYYKLNHPEGETMRMNCAPRGDGGYEN